MGNLGWVAVFAAGVLMILRPQWMWKLERFFKMKVGEPSRTYLKTCRIGGIVFCAAAFVWAVWAVLH